MGKKTAKRTSTSDMFQPSEIPDVGLFAADRRSTRTGQPGGKDSLSHDLELLAFERAVMFPAYSVSRFLEEKGYSPNQQRKMLTVKPLSEWDAAKDKVMDKITESVVKRHVDQLAEVNEQHIRASKLAMARAVEMLTKLQVTPEVEIDPRTGKKKSKPYLRSVDLMNCSNAIKSAQEIYRRAMGLNNDEGGIQQILDKVSQLNQQTNIQINNTVVNQQQTPLEQALHQMSYDQIAELIELKRQQSKALEVEGVRQESLDRFEDHDFDDESAAHSTAKIVGHS